MPERPPNVPEDAIWKDSDNEWCLPEVDSDNEYHGQVTWWRPDGTRCCITEYVHGTPEGTYKRFHENGEVSREGTFVQGSLHGTDRYYRSTAETTENFPRGLGDAIARAEMDYEMGSVKAARCYNKDDEQCMEDGAKFPSSRPDGVPADAHFRKREADGNYRWVLGTVLDNGDGTIDRVGAWRFWTPDGVLVSEENYQSGELHGTSRSFDDDGQLTEEVTWNAGERNGLTRTFEDGELVSELTYRDGDKRGYAMFRFDEDERGDGPVASKRGEFEDDDPIGVIEYLGSSGQVIAAIDTGRADDLAVTQTVLAAKSDLAGHAKRLHDECQFGPALLALVRAVGRGEVEPSRLTKEVNRLEPPLPEATRYHLASRCRMVVSNMVRFGAGPDKCVNTTLDAVRAGAAGWELLRSAAATLDDMDESAIAVEVIDGTIAAAPPELATSFEFTRGLIRASVGDAEGAKRSAQALIDGNEELGAGLKTYIGTLFPTWEFWPTHDSRRSGGDKLDSMMQRTQPKTWPELDAIRSAIQKSASRLVAHRQRIIERIGEKPWMVPDVSFLLPDGPLEVPTSQRYNGVGVQHLCRQEWTRLTWLCHLSGLDAVGLPDAITGHADHVRTGIIGWMRYFMAFDAEPGERITKMLEASDVVAEENHAEFVQRALEITANSAWFGTRIGDIETLLDVDFLHGDENAFISTLSFFGDTSVDLFDERDDEEE